MKRSNRLIILLGILLAAVAFGAILLLGSQPGGTGANATPPPTVTVVVAAIDIPVGTVVTEGMVTTATRPATEVPVDALRDTKQAVGLPARRDLFANDIVTQATFAGVAGANNADILRRLKPGFRAMGVQVDQLTGVGTLIQPGDHVDIVLGIEGADSPAKLPIVNPTGLQPYTNDQLNHTSVKVIVQDVEVLGTISAPPPAATTTTTTNQAGTSPAPTPGVTLSGQQELTILALTAQQVEIVRWAQLDGHLSLTLRATADAGKPADTTTGVTLRELVDKYGVLPPKVVAIAQP